MLALLLFRGSFSLDCVLEPPTEYPLNPFKALIRMSHLQQVAESQSHRVATGDSKPQFDNDNNDDRVTSICCLAVAVAVVVGYCWLLLVVFVWLCLALFLTLPWPGETEIEFI